MLRVTCRCGEKLKVPSENPERMDCPKCGARIRLRRSAVEKIVDADDGYLRFLCPCGRRLKVPVAARPVAGKCPDCGRVVPVPTTAKGALNPISARKRAQNDPEAKTDELDTDDLAQLREWAAKYTAAAHDPVDPSPSSTALTIADVTGRGANVDLFGANLGPPSTVKFETGLRVCPRCKKPVHLSASSCRECGTPVPRK
jgi:predicted RNA-binding Zn-ribbon protein involved in translation (DUF1610 family)